MNKMLSILFFVFIAVGCSSAPAPSDGPKPLFMMPTVALALDQVRQYPQYPDQSGLATLVQEKLKGALEKNAVLAMSPTPEALAVAVDMKYRRVFAGEATPFPSSSAGPPVVNYTVVVSRGEATVATIEQKNVTVNRGFVGNLKILFSFYMNGTPKTEAEDVDILADAIARDLAGLSIPQ